MFETCVARNSVIRGMERSDVQVLYKRKSNATATVRCDGCSVTVERVTKSLLDNGKIEEALTLSTRSHSLRFLHFFVCEIVKRVEALKPFGLSYFICFRCYEIIRDPITLKCGHTFSKKCLLQASKNDFSECPDCGQRYSVSYLSELKKNVAVLSLVEKLLEMSVEAGISSESAEKSLSTVFDCMNIVPKFNASLFDKKDLECPLCIRIFWEPVTTSCGHTFCRECLYRSLDHQPTCPLCKSSLTDFLAERVQSTTEVLVFAMKNIFPSDYSDRHTLFLEEMEKLSKAGRDPEHEIPLFVCTVALPTVPCPLHVYEPRYRLMIRQCIESGSKQFGMCGVINERMAEYGTMLAIRNVKYFPDGRSIVDAIGSKRFRILKTGERDGYHTASVELLEDLPLSNLELLSIDVKHDETYKTSKKWFMQLPISVRHQILNHFGPMPSVETNYALSPAGPSWVWWMLAIIPVEPRLKVLLLSLTSLAQRLDFLHRILLHLLYSSI